MLFAAFANRGLAWPAGVVGVFGLASIHRLGLGGLTHCIGVSTQCRSQMTAAGKDVSGAMICRRNRTRRLEETHSDSPPGT